MNEHINELTSTIGFFNLSSDASTAKVKEESVPRAIAKDRPKTKATPVVSTVEKPTVKVVSLVNQKKPETVPVQKAATVIKVPPVTDTSEMINEKDFERFK